ncbi:putative Ig domain-containing protein, partial [Puniceicoccaceae bacterium K14]|nr:putative Ig domain-containing protein [Puniceicoccaceae bacterium K14]
SWLSFNGSTFTGTPSSAPSSHSITVRASDPSGASVSASFALTVEEAPASDPITVDPSPVPSRSESISGSTADTEVRDNSQVSWSGGSSYRAGGVSSGRDGAIV